MHDLWFYLYFVILGGYSFSLRSGSFIWEKVFIYIRYYFSQLKN